VVRAILLAAGRGARLMPLTADRPKCLVEVAGQPLLSWQLDALRACGVGDIVMVRGYKRALLQDPHVRTLDNPRWSSTSMVASLLCAQSELRGDVLITYTDLLFGPAVVHEALTSRAEIGVVIDRQWRALWQRRMADPLADAETLRLGEGGRIVEIGGRPRSLAEIQGQYVGMVRLSGSGSEIVRRALLEAAAAALGTHPAPRAFGSERPLAAAHITDLLMGLIRRGECVQSIPIDGGCTEIDTRADLQVAEALVAEGLVGGRGWPVPTSALAPGTVPDTGPGATPPTRSAHGRGCGGVPR
jgi:choline kinase